MAGKHENGIKVANPRMQPNLARNSFCLQLLRSKESTGSPSVNSPTPPRVKLESHSSFSRTHVSPPTAQDPSCYDTLSPCRQANRKSRRQRMLEELMSFESSGDFETSVAGVEVLIPRFEAATGHRTYLNLEVLSPSLVNP